ncbi:MAG: hypothetical protein PHP96_01115 [Candidatus Dojkabacteria bacterium]|jgi:hypothetical protein|nr:hypothetical protein [Candidatus Dojkabacteria bacterium]MDD4560907.1 hypothetical protein [Candidatus Dojkabacteria bacterium]NLB12143.1 hypothetical protein [Candidatus Dojkabacteria bacterium]
MSLTQNDIEIIEEIVRRKIKKSFDMYFLKNINKSQKIDITYDELEKELVRVQENLKEIPVISIK